jgi:hypothetical protein
VQGWTWGATGWVERLWVREHARRSRPVVRVKARA